MCRDDKCALGRGLRTNPSGSAHYHAVTASHGEFHHAAGHVLALALARKQKSALDALSPAAKYSRVNAQLSLHRIEWLRAGLPRPI